MITIAPLLVVLAATPPPLLAAPTVPYVGRDPLDLCERDLPADITDAEARATLQKDLEGEVDSRRWERIHHSFVGAPCLNRLPKFRGQLPEKTDDLLTAIAADATVREDVRLFALESMESADVDPIQKIVRDDSQKIAAAAGVVIARLKNPHAAADAEAALKPRTVAALDRASADSLGLFDDKDLTLLGAEAALCAVAQTDKEFCSRLIVAGLGGSHSFRDVDWGVVPFRHLVWAAAHVLDPKTLASPLLNEGVQRPKSTMFQITDDDGLDPDTRCEVLANLVASIPAEPHTRDLTRQWLTSPTNWQAVCALNALADSSKPATVAAPFAKEILNLVNDRDPEVRAAAVEASRLLRK